MTQLVSPRTASASPRRRLGVWSLLPMVLACGCGSGSYQAPRFTTTILNPLNLELPFLPHEKPVRIGLADRDTGIFDPATWDVAQVGAPWTPLRYALERHLDKPVQMSEMEPFQLAAHLQSGRIDFALLPAGDYLSITDEFGDCGKVIAISRGNERRGLIVVRADSSIQSIAELEGKRFAFGPAGDPVLDLGAKEALRQAGLDPEKLQKELVPVPGTFQHHISANESAYEVVYGIGTEAGVIEKGDYEHYPEKGGSLLFRRFSKDNFRVLGETAPYRVETLPDGPVVAAPDADPALIEKVTDFLFEAEQKQPDAMRALGLHLFESPPADVQAELRRMAAEQGSPSAAPERPATPATPTQQSAPPARSSSEPLPMTPVPQ